MLPLDHPMVLVRMASFFFIRRLVSYFRNLCGINMPALIL